MLQIPFSKDDSIDLTEGPTFLPYAMHLSVIEKINAPFKLRETGKTLI